MSGDIGSVAACVDSGEMIRTIHGFELQTGPDIWLVPSPCCLSRFDFTKLPRITERLKAAIKVTVASLLVKQAPSQVWGDLCRLKGLLTVATAGSCELIDLLNVEHFETLEASLPPDRWHELRRMSSFLSRWHEMGSWGVSDDLIDHLAVCDFPCFVSGTAVRTCCPDKGPLSREAKAQLEISLHASYKCGETVLDEYVASLLAVTLAVRPMQLALVKVRDVCTQTESPYIMVTRIKQGEGVRPRTYFRRRGLHILLAEVITLQVNVARAWAETSGIEPDNAPLFPRRVPAATRRPRIPCLPGFEGHMTTSMLGLRLTKALNRVELTASDGRHLHVNAQRLRRTKATHANADGHSPGVVAAIMDQTSTSTQRDYVAVNAGLIARLDAAYGTPLIALASGFLGTVEPTGTGSGA